MSEPTIGQNEPGRRVDEEARSKLPPGVKLLRTLEGHRGAVRSLAFDPQGRMLASASDDKTVKLWAVRSGKLLRTLEGHQGIVWSVAFDPQGETLASASLDNTVKLWEAHSGKLLRTLEGQWGWVHSVTFDPPGETLASGTGDETVKLWEVHSGKLLRPLEGHKGTIYSVTFDPQGGTLASGSGDNTVKLWEARSGKLLRTFEGHTARIDHVVFSPDGRLLASKSADQTIRLWSCQTWETIAVIPGSSDPTGWFPALAFHPTLPLLASGGSEPDTAQAERCRLIHLWELDFDVLLGKRTGVAVPSKALHHTTAKIVLVGDSGVGKTGLGWRLAHGEFKEHSSTHGQQFWVMQQLGTRRRDGTECEAILWDLAGQPDYRLIHALFLDDADLALVLFDPTDTRDPLHGVEFWLRQLEVRVPPLGGPAPDAPPPKGGTPTLLVAARADRGIPTLTDAELQDFCQRRGLRGYIRTSAKAGEGLEELIQRMKGLIPWEDKPAVTTEITFKRVKDFVLDLKEHAEGKPVVVSWPDLREQLERHFAKLANSEAEAAKRPLTPAPLPLN